MSITSLAVLPLLLMLCACSTLAAPGQAASTLEGCTARAACDPLPGVQRDAGPLHEVPAAAAPRQARKWLDCAATSYTAMVSGGDPSTHRVGTWTRCSDQFLSLALTGRAPWQPGRRQVLGIDIDVQFRGLSRNLQPPLRVVRSAQVPIRIPGGRPGTVAGYGVPLVVWSRRCVDRPECSLFPPEGIARPATGWIETDQAGHPTLVIAGPDAAVAPGIPGTPAVDSTAAYAWLARTSSLGRLGVWGLLGGKALGRRSGLYLLEDYDPGKRPIVMIHGLGSNPLIWARLSSAIWADPELSRRYQVWHMVYQTNAPQLTARYRAQNYLNAVLDVLDSEGDDPARSGIVLIGHSMGGVVARLLCADASPALWDSAFTVAPEDLVGADRDLQVIGDTFRFRHFPGVTRAIFLATPHHGSPTADGWIGKLVAHLVRGRPAELDALRRIAADQPEAIRKELRDSIFRFRINSIATLRVSHPVRVASQSLMPVPTIAYDTIAGRRRGSDPPGDGVVPLQSALLDGAETTTILDANHYVYEHPEAIATVLRILRQDAPVRRDVDSAGSTRAMPSAFAEGAHECGNGLGRPLVDLRVRRC
ncbi:alpha/beta fold hydrolase [Stenotrophomonas tuberculopleuritidis]|uniref:alpha/beta fold hydrolase n=1 Tax=Stenotrophomonas tuberculopleuritidis TaxID=3055079 RepID=UPI0026E57735|nr:alpha/beta hydrolase [Stenotrophomonas sp. 704A1]